MGRKATVTAPGPLSLKISEMVRAAIDNSPHGQNAVAEAARVSSGQLSEVLTGKKQFTIGQLDRVCFVLDIPLRELIKNADEATRDRYITMDIEALASSS